MRARPESRPTKRTPMSKVADSGIEAQQAALQGTSYYGIENKQIRSYVDDVKVRCESDTTIYNDATPCISIRCVVTSPPYQWWDIGSTHTYHLRNSVTGECIRKCMVVFRGRVVMGDVVYYHFNIKNQGGGYLIGGATLSSNATIDDIANAINNDAQ
jgi:hypothetical protein